MAGGGCNPPSDFVQCLRVSFPMARRTARIIFCYVIANIYMYIYVCIHACFRNALVVI